MDDQAGERSGGDDRLDNAPGAHRRSGVRAEFDDQGVGPDYQVRSAGIHHARHQGVPASHSFSEWTIKGETQPLFGDGEPDQEASDGECAGGASGGKSREKAGRGSPLEENEGMSSWPTSDTETLELTQVIYIC